MALLSLSSVKYSEPLKYPELDTINEDMLLLKSILPVTSYCDVLRNDLIFDPDYQNVIHLSQQ